MWLLFFQFAKNTLMIKNAFKNILKNKLTYIEKNPENKKVKMFVKGNKQPVIRKTYLISKVNSLIFIKNHI